MASVAAIYTVERFVRTPEEILPLAEERGEKPRRPEPEQKRVWASLANSPMEVIAAMFDEAEQRDPKRKKQWIALVDGNRTQIEYLQKLAHERKLDLLIVVDFIHVAQYVWQASLAFFPDNPSEQDRWVRAHLLEVLRGKASLVAAGMRRSATLRALASAERQAVDDCADYLINYSPFLRYDKALADGVPIATGVIEGACRHLVEDRMILPEHVGVYAAPKPCSAYAPYARVTISMLIGRFTRNRSTNAITRRTMPIIMYRTLCCPRPSYPNPVDAVL
jgi:hypothetical protein